MIIEHKQQQQQYGSESGKNSYCFCFFRFSEYIFSNGYLLFEKRFQVKSVCLIQSIDMYIG